MPLPVLPLATGFPAGRLPDHEPDPGLQLSGAALLAWRRRLLDQGGRSSDLDWLLDLAGGLGWSALQRLRLNPDASIRLQRSLESLEAIWDRHRQTAEPLQYLVGLCPWRDMELTVAPGVLIPRQETDLLVDLALSSLPAELLAKLQSGPAGAAPAGESEPPPLLWADLGTGSGCVALALGLALPRARGLAVDCSDQALAQARHNRARFGLQETVKLIQGDWWVGLEPWWGQIDLVVANPPYIPSAVIAGLDPVVRDHEPRLALDGGVDGLEAIRAITAGATQALAPGGALLLEHHHDQSAAVLDLLNQAGLVSASAHADLEGTLRFARAFRSRADG
jgi:release factor glutamine methyltransferase